MSPFNFFNWGKQDLRAVIDVGSHSIKAFVFTGGSGGRVPRAFKKIVVKLTEAERRTGKSGRGPEYSSFLIPKLHELLFFLIRELGKIPYKIVIGFSPYFAESQLVTWGMRPEKPARTFTKKELEGMFQNVWLKQRDDKYLTFTVPLEVLVNDYPVAISEGLIFPKESWIQTISFRTLLLRFPESIGRELLEMRQSLGGLPVEFIPLVAAYALSIPYILSVEDALLLDIGGEETTVALLQNGLLRHVARFPSGVRHFLRSIAESSSVSLDEAEDLKRQYVQDILSEEKRVKLARDFSAIAAQWENMFFETLESCYTLGPLPSQVILMGGGAYIPELVSIIRKPGWIKNYSYISSPTLRIISAQSFFEGNSLNGFLQGPEDVGLASLLTYSLNNKSIFS